MSMEKPYERLRQSREAAGFKSASAAARKFGWGDATYRHHENGTRSYSVEQAVKYGEAFGVSPMWLLDIGLSGSDSWRVPINKFYIQSLLPELSWKDGVEGLVEDAHKVLGLSVVLELSLSPEGIGPVEDEAGYPLFHLTSPNSVGVERGKFERGFMFYTRAPEWSHASLIRPGDLLLIDSERGEITDRPELLLLRSFETIVVGWAQRQADGRAAFVPDAFESLPIPIDRAASVFGRVAWIGRTM